MLCLLSRGRGHGSAPGPPVMRLGQEHRQSLADDALFATSGAVITSP
jgi:hypothetical protein